MPGCLPDIVHGFGFDALYKLTTFTFLPLLSFKKIGRKMWEQ